MLQRLFGNDLAKSRRYRSSFFKSYFFFVMFNVFVRNCFLIMPFVFLSLRGGKGIKPSFKSVFSASSCITRHDSDRDAGGEAPLLSGLVVVIILYNFYINQSVSVVTVSFFVLSDVCLQ